MFYYEKSHKEVDSLERVRKSKNTTIFFFVAFLLQNIDFRFKKLVVPCSNPVQYKYTKIIE